MSAQDPNPSNEHTSEHGSYEVITLADAQAREPLTCDKLRWRCDPDSFPFKTTETVDVEPGVIGQDGALEALQFGLEIHAPGQNIFVRGISGTGRMTLVYRLLKEIKPQCPEARDRCYVHHFAQPDRPRLITLPRGQGKAFQRCIDDLADFIRDDLSSALNAEPVRVRQSVLEQQAQKQIDAIVKPFEEKIGKDGLSLVSVQVGPAAQAALVPLHEGKPVQPEQWEELRSKGEIDDAQATKIRDKIAGYQSELRDVMTRINEIRHRLADALKELRAQAVRAIMEESVRMAKQKFPTDQVAAFLDELVEDAATVSEGSEEKQEGDDGRRFRVNVLMSHDKKADCPIVIEHTPTVNNLLGGVDSRFDGSRPARSDHMSIRAGSLLRADGGYLILEASDVLREPGAWKVLVRTLRTGKLEIVPNENLYSWWGQTLKPQPIDIHVKVILLGDANLYYLLDAYDPDFPELFKVLADFGYLIPRDDSNMARYSGVLARLIKDENLPHFDHTAVAALVEHGARIAGRRNSLTTRFGRLADIAREAAFLTRKAERKHVIGDDVRSAVRRTKERANLPSRRFREYLAEGTIRVATTGAEVGQINGLAVTHAGPLTFGFPARITASIGPGTSGVINIERESEMSGSVHTKGFYILGGLLRKLLKTDHPLAFHASIAFEQSYGGIDGDSASAAEICSLLSALTDIPLRQDLAMTGAIDQLGHVLAIGAANEKIEGFFETCRDLGLTGTQGVIIPQANAPDLMLRHDVVEACAAGQFHVYAVETIQEALELFTGIEAGVPNEYGVYEPNTLLGVAVAKAFEYWVKAVQGLDGFAGSIEAADASDDQQQIV